MARERERIVVGADFSPAGDAALGRVETLCGRGAPVRIDLAYVVAPLDVPSAFDLADAGHEQAHERAAAAALATAAARLRRRLGAPARVFTHLLHGAPWVEICALATRRGASLIVVGRHAHPGTAQTLIGSVADRVVRLAPCAVLVVPRPAPAPSSPRTRTRTRGGRRRA